MDPVVITQMGTIYWEGQDDRSNSKASELEYVDRPLILKVKLPFTDYLSFLDYVRLLRASKFLGWYRNDLIESRVSDARSPFRRTSSWLDNPKLSDFSDFLAENLRRYRRSRSTNDIYDLAVEYASSVAVVSRSGRPDARTVAPTSMLLSDSSTSVASSYRSKPSPCPSISKGQLRCEWNDGSLDMSFSEDDNPGKLYSATSHKIGPSSGRTSDYTYVFRSRVGNEASDEFVGKMKVFTSIVLRPDRTRRTETEFVLYGAREDRSKEVKSTKRKGFSNKVMDLFRPNRSSERKPNSQGSCVGEAGDDLRDHELAAIVVDSAHEDGDKEAAVGGWGLKFLEKVSVEHTDTSTGPYRRRVDVLIPAGAHGNGGSPTSIIERWQTGHCDCGGWDLGCPLTVLCNAESVEDAREDCKSVDLFIEGMRHGKPSLTLANTSDGLYTLHFQRSLSALQAFAVGVAIVHTQTPVLHTQTPVLNHRS